MAYWEKRASQWGGRAVYDLRHPSENLPQVDARQKKILYGHLAGCLDGSEKRILDYGCGIGRFSAELAQMTKGRVIAMDPIQKFLDMAPEDRLVQYILSEPGSIHLESRSVDLVWICLVLGGITDPCMLRRTVSEIKKVIKPNGLIFLVENTDTLPALPYWRYRSVESYRQLFDFADMKLLGTYLDGNQTISVMAGRVR
jgi:SAM-dependent methyltransferase